MLYDVFVSHASEDKADFVRPLVERLQNERLEVWYDEFTLNVGDSLRRSIDHGLAQSRYGIVVLSPAFFSKRWPQWEMDGLVARQNSGGADIILPVWLDVDRDAVVAYSPPLADRVAVLAASGLDEVVRRLVRVIRPKGSALVFARDYLIGAGVTPPVISDDYWLDVAAAAESNESEGSFQEAMGWGRWGFPLRPSSTDPNDRGLRLAFAALQMAWQDAAEDQVISQITRPDEVHEFIASQPMLMDTCEDYLPYLLSYAPQLTVPGFGGPFEDAIQELFEARIRSGKVDELLALRSPTFAGLPPSYIACSFVQGDSTSFGPPVSVYEPIDYAAWLLSDESDWLPTPIKAMLLTGLGSWAIWPWTRYSGAAVQRFHFEPEPFTGTLAKSLHRARTRQTFRLTKDGRRDLVHRLGFSTSLLGLPESGEVLAEQFLAAGFLDGLFERVR